MLDMIGAIGSTAIYAVLVGVLVGLSAARSSAKRAAFATAAAWGALIVAITALGGFGSGVSGPIPTPVIAFALAVAALFAGWRLAPRFRHALLGVPLPALVGVNAARLAGIFFLLLAADGRLGAPFAPVAGAGDMLVGALAAVLAVMMIGGRVRPGWLRAWNALGALDLVVAIGLGALSARGAPFQVFTAEPGTLAMTTLPWIMIPAMLVPLFLFIHYTIATRLAAMRRSEHVDAVAGTLQRRTA